MQNAEVFRRLKREPASKAVGPERAIEMYRALRARQRPPRGGHRVMTVENGEQYKVFMVLGIKGRGKGRKLMAVKNLLFVAAFLLIAAVPSYAQYGGSCAHQGCAASGTVNSGVSAGAEIFCNLPECFFWQNPPAVTTSAWATTVGYGCYDLTFTFALEESWTDGYVTSWITLSLTDYPGYPVASFGVGKDYSGAELARSEWVAPGLESCIDGGAS